MSDRKFVPSLSELIDRLSIDQLKEVLLPEYKDKYAAEMQDIMHDIDSEISDNKVVINSRLIRAIIIVAQLNAHIWYNESAARKGEIQDLNLLILTHGLNGLRQQYKNIILNEIGALKGFDYKTDCLAAEFKGWEISLK